MNSLEECLLIFSKHTIHIIGGVTGQEDYMPLDLSCHNLDLTTFDITNAKAFETYVNLGMQQAGKKVAYGGYNETRDIYSRSAHFFKENKLEERNIHLGIDFWCDVNTPVLAALDGIIHSFKNNTEFGDYGPTLILEHCIDDLVFYALYGHLSLVSIKGLKVGDKVCKGNVIGYLGDASVNGDYAPHLHYQLINDMEDNFGDFRGVTSLNDLAKDLANCPDPNLLLKIHK
jgi:murein DD-endopeptidase MepM/ murein hydrolase activator NlpD